MYVTLTKKRIFTLLCALSLAFVLIGQFLSLGVSGVEVSTNAERVQFIATLGIDLESDAFNEKQVTVPYEFSDVYEKYNTLQKTAGFDLSAFKGKNITVYTYLTSDNRAVNLMVYETKLIGGDIADLNVNGQMTALKGKNNEKRTF